MTTSLIDYAAAFFVPVSSSPLLAVQLSKTGRLMIKRNL